MKKMIILFTFIAVFLSVIPFQTYAIEDDYAYSDTNVTIITPTAFQELFKTSAIDNVRYSYAMNVSDETCQKALVFVQVELSIAGSQYYFTTQGYVRAYPLPSGEIFWEGHTEGILMIEENEYTVIAAFSKLDNSDIPMLVISVQGKDTPLVGFYFGANHINDEVQQVMSQQTPVSVTDDNAFQSLDNPSLIINPAETMSPLMNEVVQEQLDGGGTMNLGPNYEWDYEGSCFSDFATTGVTGYGLRSRAYFWPEMNQLAITTKSYCNNVSSYYSTMSSFLVQYTSISEMSVTVDMDTANMNGANGAYILGLMSYDFDTSDYGKWGRALKPLFEELMSRWDYGSSIVSALLDTLTGQVDTSVSETTYANTASVNISFGLLDYANFDNSSAGIPLVFVLSRASSSYVGSSPVTATTTMKYRTYIYNQFTGQYLYMYTVSESAAIDLVLDLG